MLILSRSLASRNLASRALTELSEGEVPDEGRGVVGEQPFAHGDCELELPHHLDFEVEDLTGVVQQQEGVFQQNVPELSSLEVPAPVLLVQSHQFFSPHQEDLPDFLQQLSDLPLSEPPLLPLHEEHH